MARDPGVRKCWKGERTGQLAGAALWGLGRVVTREAPQLQSRMLDLDPEAEEPQAVLADELLFPDSESHIAHRQGRRQVARLVRTGSGANRLALPEETDWVLAPDDGGAIETLRVQPSAAPVLEPKEVRVAVEACAPQLSRRVPGDGPGRRGVCLVRSSVAGLSKLGSDVNYSDGRRTRSRLRVRAHSGRRS